MKITNTNKIHVASYYLLMFVKLQFHYLDTVAKIKKNISIKISYWAFVLDFLMEQKN